LQNVLTAGACTTILLLGDAIPFLQLCAYARFVPPLKSNYPDVLLYNTAYVME
jgi:hypothetical protein